MVGVCGSRRRGDRAYTVSVSEERSEDPDRTCVTERKLKTSQWIYTCSHDEAARAAQQEGTLSCVQARED